MPDIFVAVIRYFVKKELGVSNQEHYTIEQSFFIVKDYHHYVESLDSTTPEVRSIFDKYYSNFISCEIFIEKFDSTGSVL